MARPVGKSLQHRSAAFARWANCSDPSAATAPARNAFHARFERQVDPDGTLPADERARRAEAAERSYMLELSRKAVAARARKKAERANG
jgi:hypothetical protein